MKLSNKDCALIADALAIISPDGIRAQQRVMRLESYFRAVAQSVNFVDTIKAGN